MNFDPTTLEWITSRSLCKKTFILFVCVFIEHRSHVGHSRTYNRNEILYCEEKSKADRLVIMSHKFKQFQTFYSRWFTPSTLNLSTDFPMWSCLNTQTHTIFYMNCLNLCICVPHLKFVFTEDFDAISQNREKKTKRNGQQDYFISLFGCSFI